MRNALVAGNSYFGLDAGGAFDAKFHERRSASRQFISLSSAAGRDRIFLYLYLFLCFLSARKQRKRKRKRKIKSGNEEDFLRVRVLDLGPRRETADIYVTRIRRVRARHKTGLVRNGNPVGQIAFRRLVHGRSRRLRRSFRRVTHRRRRTSVRVVGLLRRRIRRRSRGRITRWMPSRANGRLVLACGKQSKSTEQRQRERKFHKRF